MAGLIVSSKSAAARHGVYLIEKTPPPVIQAIGTGVVAIVAQFPWGPQDQIYEPENIAAAKMTVAPPGMTRTGSGYLSLLGKAFPALRLVRVLGSGAAAAEATIDDGAGTPVDIITLTLKYPGSEGNNVTATISAASDGDANHFNLLVAVTGASGTTEDLIENFNASATGTQTVLTQAQKNRLRLLGGVEILDSGRPANGTYNFTGGADGTVDATRYVGTAGSADRGIALLEQDLGVRHVCVDDPGNTIRDAVNSGLVAHATRMADRMVYLNGDSGQTAASARTDVASFRSMFARYIDSWVYIYDDTTGAEQLVPPASFAASVASQLSPSTSMAWKATEVQAMLQGIIRLEADRGDQAATNTAAGICTLIREENGGHTFEADVTTIAPSDPAKKLGARTQMLIYMGKGIQQSLRGSVDAPNVAQNRDDITVAVDAFMDRLKRAQKGDPNHTPHVVDYVMPPLDEVNTPDDYAAGDVEVPLDVQLSSAMERIFIAIKAGTTPIVSVREAA
ncbi:hypothetical protein [Sorangium sp. So ce233]|uniref:hypothetical protein n=1 Tax=Sorangium sp. So ce233 TaxID=3133290 RepID=UPI003F6418F7